MHMGKKDHRNMNWGYGCHTTGNTPPGLAIAGGGPQLQGKYAPQKCMACRTVKPQMNKSSGNARMSKRKVTYGPCQSS